MEIVIFKSDSKKDMNLLVSLAKKMGIDVEKVKSKKNEIDENSPEYEFTVDRNLGRIMNECRDSESVSYEEVKKALNKWK